MALQDVSFGRPEAEADPNLATYFVDTGVLRKFRIGTRQFVLGRKGSGKTALFKLATAATLGRHVIDLDFGEYPWDLHRLVREGGLSPESAYMASWRFTFLTAFARHIANSSDGAIAKQGKHILQKIFRDDQPTWLEAIVTKLGRLRRVDLPNMDGVGGLGGVELDEAPEGPVLANSLSQWSRVLLEYVNANFRNHPVTIKLDRLDDGWDASEESKLMLIGILKASRDLNLQLAQAGTPSALIVFLRSDIYNELHFNDRNKLRGDAEFLEWVDESLLDIAKRRIAVSLGVAVEHAWDSVFSGEEMRQRARISSYILKRTMGRPRDIIAFCSACVDVALSRGHDIVRTEDVYEAEGRYSQHIYDELDDEMHKQLPESHEYLQVLRDIGRTRFTYEEWRTAHEKRGRPISEAKIAERLKHLFDYSVVGIPRSGGAARGTTFRYAYNDRLLEPNFDSVMTVHPALKKTLGLVEGAAGGAGDDGDEG